MKFTTSFFLSQLLIICCKYSIIDAKPMVGIYVMELTGGHSTFVVSVKRINPQNPNPANDHLCTGTLISNKDVLTTVHCVNKEVEYGIELVMGDSDMTVGQKFHICWWMSYSVWMSLKKATPEYETNDVAILRLIETVPSHIKPAEISTPFDMVGIKAVVYGWSKTDSQIHAKYLKTASVRVISNEECERRIHKLNGETVEIPSNLICTASNPYAILSDGDSGGPLVYHNMIVGINRGFCPVLSEPNYEEQVNIHHPIEYYVIFIRDVMYNYL